MVAPTATGRKTVGRGLHPCGILQLAQHAKGMRRVDSLKRRLEALVAGSETDHEVAAKAGAVLLDLIRVEGRANQLLAAGPASGLVTESFLGMPLQRAAVKVLEDAGEPLHVRELAARIKAGGWRHPRARGRGDQLTQQLAARLPRYAEFRRVRPNTFGLASWGDQPRRRTEKRPRALFEGTDRNVARWIGEHPDAVFEDE
jgi:hypothetical protein